METKTTLTKKTIQKVQKLIETNIDSSKLLADAAAATKDRKVEDLFTDLAATRSGFAKELQSYVILNKEKAEDSGSLEGSVRSHWLRFRSAINGGDPKVVLIEAERGEDHIKETYEDVLKETAGSALNSVLTHQYAKVKAGHDRVRDLRDAFVEK